MPIHSIAACLLLASMGLVRVDSGAAAALGREIARLRAEATVVPGPQQGALEDRLTRAADALAAGRLWLALYELQPAWEMQSAFAFAAGSGVRSAEAFEVRWKAIGVPRAAPPDGRARAIFVEALAQGAEGRGPATYHASLPYSRDAGLDAGLYYLGESQAFGRFAALARGLDLPASGAAPALRSLEPELSALEADVLDAYQEADGDARRPFIGISVTLKLARQLDRQQRRPGALLHYLLARYRFAVSKTADTTSAAVRSRLAAARSFGPEADHSIAQFFLELAEAGAAGSPPGARAAAAILDDVLPAYRAAIR